MLETLKSQLEDMDLQRSAWLLQDEAKTVW